MSLELTPDQRQTGKANFARLVGHHQQTRREFMKGLAAAGAAVPIGAAAFFGYQSWQGNPVRAALIGAGDEGGILVGEHNPDYLQFIAVCDIRPTSMDGIFKGARPEHLRKGFRKIYGTAAEKITKYTDYKDVLANKDIEAVVIALPLHLHAPVAIEAMRAGKHVLCEKLMAWNIKQCKEMIKVSEETNKILSIGHQRHYSMLYAYALEMIQAGELGSIHHIRAFWHRHNAMPKLDTKGNPLMVQAFDVKTGKPIDGEQWPAYTDSWRREVNQLDRAAIGDKIRSYGYRSLEELVSWRLYDRTGGGLMAELGSHQLDATSIFLGKVKPLAVSGVGGKYFYRDDREVEDHVYCTFEFPGKNYWADPAHTQVKDKNDVVVVTYSSINTNKFEPWGEVVMGTNGTLIVEKEEEALYYPTAGRATSVSVSSAGGGKPAAAADSTWTGDTAKAKEAAGQTMLGSAAPVSKGYREEMEHFAFCVRQWEKSEVLKLPYLERPLPRCHGRVAMADAIIAHTANQAMRGNEKNGFVGQRVPFQKEWFDANSTSVPDTKDAESV